MSHLTPLAGFAQLRHVPQFIGNLRADLAVLFTPDLPKAMVPPARENFSDDAFYCAAVKNLARQYKFLVLREAVRKQGIRESLWPRFVACWYLGAPLSFSFCVVLAIIWVSCAWINPRIYQQFALVFPFCMLALIAWIICMILKRIYRQFVPAKVLKRTALMNPDRGHFAGIRGQSPLLRDSKSGQLLIPDLSVLSSDCHATKFSDEDLNLLYGEVLRRRKRWRVRHYAKLLFFIGTLTLPWLMPAAALRW